MKLRPNLEVERLKRGLSIKAAAAEIGISPSVLVKAEAGEPIQAAKQKAIADFYGYKVTHIWPVQEAVSSAG